MQTTTGNLKLSAHQRSSFSMRKGLLMSCFSLLTAATFAQFTPGNVVVMQAGDGTSTLTSTGNPILLREYSITGTPTFSLALPSTTVSGNALVTSGSASSEGLMTLSANGTLLIIPGYASTYTSSIASANGTVVPRAIGQVNAAGSYTRIATSTTFYTGNNIRGAASDGLGNYWGAGASQGTNYFGTVSTPTLVQNTSTNNRNIAIFNNQLYFSTGSGTHGIYKIGSGLPVNATTATSVIATGSASSPYQFAFNAASNVCYIADDATTANGGGVQKWTYSGSAWSLAYTYTFTTNPRGLTVNFSGTNPVIYATTGESSANRLVSIVDGGSVASSTVTTLATSPANTVFRGVAFSPCSAPVINTASNSGPACMNSPLVLNGSVSGSAPFTYSWSGAGTIAPSNSLTAVVNGATSSNYTLTVTNACGTASAVTTVTVTSNPSPTVTANATSTAICLGQPVTLTGGGALTYSWTSGVSNGSAFTPTSTSNYTVVGVDMNNCVGTATVNVTVNPLPTVSVNSATICAGSTATLTASGATTYTWSTTDNTASIMESPASSASYTVMGTDANGCMGTNIAMITVNTLPAITVNSATICAGATATLTASGATTYTWNTTDNTASIMESPASSTGYTVMGTDGNGCVGMNSSMITVNALPTISVNSATICTGATATLTASGATTYTWSTTDNTASIIESPASDMSYTVMGTDANGCMGMNMAMITVNMLPTISVNSATICAGSMATLTASGATTYTWSTTDNTASIMESPASDMTYTVMGTDANGCMGMNMAMITVNMLPTISVNSATICAGATATLTASGATTYTWSTTDNTASIMESPASDMTYTVMGTDANGCMGMNMAMITVNMLPSVSLAPIGSAPFCTTDPGVTLNGSPSGGVYAGTGVTANTFGPAAAGVGTYTITYSYTDANSCSNSAAATVTVALCTGIESYNTPETSIYPNPVQDHVSIRFANAGTEYTVSVFNVAGSQVYTANTTAEVLVIHTETFEQGVYIVKISSANTGVKTSRIVKN